MTDKKMATLVKRCMKARARGLSWVEIQNEGICSRGQIGAIRKEMRRLDPNSVSNSGPRAAEKPKAKKAAKNGPKSTKKAKKTTAKKRSSR